MEPRLENPILKIETWNIPNANVEFLPITQEGKKQNVLENSWAKEATYPLVVEMLSLLKIATRDIPNINMENSFHLPRWRSCKTFWKLHEHRRAYIFFSGENALTFVLYMPNKRALLWLYIHVALFQGSTKFNSFTRSYGTVEWMRSLLQRLRLWVQIMLWLGPRVGAWVEVPKHMSVVTCLCRDDNTMTHLVWIKSTILLIKSLRIPSLQCNINRKNKLRD